MVTITKIHSVKFNAIMNMLLTASNMIVSVVTIPYVTRVLSVEGYGDVNFAYSVSQWFSAFCLVGIPMYGIRECAKVRDDRKELAATTRDLLVIISIFTAIFLSVFAVLIVIVPRFRGIEPLMWIFLVSTLLLSYGVEWYFQATEQYSYITVRSAAFKIVSLFLILILVRHPGDFIIYAAILAFVVSGNNIINLIRLFRTESFKDLRPMKLSARMKPIFSFAILYISSAFYLSFDSVILGMLSVTSAQVGFYQLAAKLKNMLASIANAVTGALIPRLSYYAEHDIEKYRRLLSRGFSFLLNLGVGIAFIIFIFAKTFVILISSEKYLSATLSIAIIGFVTLLNALNYFFSLCVLTSFDRERKVAVANFVGVPVSIVVNLLLDGHIGATGAALGGLAAEGTIFIFQFWYSRDIVCKSVHLNAIYKVFLSHITACGVTYFAYFLVISKVLTEFTTLQTALAIVAGVFVYALIWIAASLLMKEDTARWMFSIAKDILYKIFAHAQ